MEDRIRQLEERNRQLEERNRQLELKLSDVIGLIAVTNNRLDSIDKRIGGIEDSSKWIVRLIVGAPVAAILAYMIRGGFAP